MDFIPVIQMHCIADGRVRSTQTLVIALQLITIMCRWLRIWDQAIRWSLVFVTVDRSVAVHSTLCSVHDHYNKKNELPWVGLEHVCFGFEMILCKYLLVLTLSHFRGTMLGCTIRSGCSLKVYYHTCASLYTTTL